MRVLIVGGGIAGLAAAHALAETAHDRCQITLVEAAARLGGKIETCREDGFIIEGGPDVFLTTKPAALQLCERLGLTERVVETRRARVASYVVRDGLLHPMPGGLASFVPTRWRDFITTRLLSWPARLRMGLEPWIPARNDLPDESMEAFFSHRLGHEAYTHLVEPMLAGIYAGQGSGLGMEATFPQYRRLVAEHGSLLRATLATRPAPSAAGGRSLFASLRGGLGELVDTIATRLAALHTQVHTATRVTALTPTSDGLWRAQLVEAAGGSRAWEGEQVVLAVPAWASAHLLDEQQPELARLLRSIEHASTATISFAFAASATMQPLDAHGFLVPRAEGSPLLACTWSSSKWQGRAPSHTVLMRAYLGGAGRAAELECSDAVLEQRALGELFRLMRFRAEPLRRWIHRWPDAMPQYGVGHREKIAAIEAATVPLRGLQLIGASYRGLGLPDCIADGERAAGRILALAAAPGRGS